MGARGSLDRGTRPPPPSGAAADACPCAGRPSAAELGLEGPGTTPAASRSRAGQGARSWSAPSALRAQPWGAARSPLAQVGASLRAESSPALGAALCSWRAPALIGLTTEACSVRLRLALAAAP
jgi:hypothetical protein